jgi:hypothetical protein
MAQRLKGNDKNRPVVSHSASGFAWTKPTSASAHTSFNNT